MRVALPIAALAALSTSACARHEPSCVVPVDLPRPMLEGPTSGEPRRLLPIASYTLAISWSPQYCASRMTSPRDRIQCDGDAGRFGFTLHGLWPDGPGEKWPQYCTPTRLVPETVIRDNLCSTPSVQLIQHEWEKHGTCVSPTPAAYFARSAKLYRALKFPDMAPFQGKATTVQAFRQAFADANAGMKPDQMRLNVSKDGWLQEVWLCLDKSLNRQTCPTAHQDGASPTALIKIR
jgi:ribonuclease T2